MKAAQRREVIFAARELLKTPTGSWPETRQAAARLCDVLPPGYTIQRAVRLAVPVEHFHPSRADQIEQALKDKNRTARKPTTEERYAKMISDLRKLESIPGRHHEATQEAFWRFMGTLSYWSQSGQKSHQALARAVLAELEATIEERKIKEQARLGPDCLDEKPAAPVAPATEAAA